MTSIAHDRMRLGLCPDCETGVLHHGPWTDEQIQAAADDICMAVADFRDCCDECFVRYTGLGDRAYAERLAGRPLRFPNVIAKRL